MERRGAPCWVVALTWGRAGAEVCSPAQGLFPGWVTNAGQTKQTPDITPLPVHPVCLPGQGLQDHPGGFLPLWEGPSHSHLNNAEGDSARGSPEKPGV